MFDISIQIQSSRKRSSFFSFLITSMLWIDSLPSGLQYIVDWSSHIQYLAILYWGMFQLVLPVKQTDIVSYLHSIAEVLTFQSIMTTTALQSIKTFLTAIVYAYLILFLLGLVLISKAFRRHQQIARKLGTFINFLTFFHFAVGFWIANIILMNNYQTLEENGTSFAGSMLVINIVNLVFIFFNYLFGFFSAFLSYDPLTTTNLLSSHTSKFQLMTFSFKALIAPVIKIFSVKSFAAWYFVIVSLIMSAIRHYYLITKFPYYNFRPMKTSICFSFISTLICVFNLVLLPLSQRTDVSATSIVYVHILLWPFLLKIAGSYIRASIMNFLSIENSTIISESLALKKLFALDCLSARTDAVPTWMKRSGRSELELWGAVSNTFHKKNGWNSFQSKKMHNVNGEPLSLKEHADSLINEFLIQIILRIKSNNKLRIVLANRLAEESKTLHMAIGFLSGVSNQHFLTSISAYKLYIKLQKKVEDIYKTREEVLDVKTVIDQTVILNKFVKMIYANSKLFINFWETYKKSNPRILTLLKKSREIEKEDLKINKFWVKNIQNRKIFACSLGTLYSVYLSLVRNAPFSAFKLMETYPPIAYNKKNLSEDELPLNKTNLFGSRNIILTASMARDKLGKVLYASHNITELIGWTQHDILGSNVNLLIQPQYRELHNQILTRHIENKFDPKRKSKLYQNIQTFVVNKDGKSLPCCLYLAMHPYIQQDLVYVGMLRVKALNKYLSEKKDKPYKNRFTSTTLRHKYTLSRVAQMSRTSIPPSIESYNEIKTKKSLTQDDKKSRHLETPKNANDVGSVFSIDFHKEQGEDDESMEVPYERPQQDRIKGKARKSIVRHCQERQSVQKLESDVESLMREVSDRQGIKMNDGNELSSELSSKPEINSLSMAVSVPSPVQKQKFSNIAGMSVTSNTSTLKSYISKVEQGVYAIPKTPKIEYLRYLLIIFLIVTSALLIGFHIKNTALLSVASQTIEMLSASTFRLFRIVETARMSQVYPFVESGLMSPLRYISVSPAPDARMVIEDLLEKSMDELSLYNNQVRNSLYILDDELQAKFYDEKMPVVEMDASGVISTNRTANTFDLCTDIVAAASRLLVTPYSEATFQDPDFVLISSNTRNDLLLSSLEAINIQRQDLEQRSQDEIDVIIIVAALIAFSSLFALFIFFWLLRIVVKNRNRITDIFMRLEVKSIEMKMTSVGKFCTALEKNHMNTKALNTNLNMNIFIGLPAKKETVKTSGLYKRRKADSKGINISIVTMSVYGVFLMVLVFSAFFFVLALVLNQNAGIIKKTNLMMDSDLTLYNIDLLYASLYPFIYLNMSTTVYNRPITETWDELFTQVTQAQNNFVQLIDPKEGIGNIPELELIIKGSLCDAIENDPAYYPYCESTAAGALLKGVIGGTSLLLSILQRIKESFEVSSRTFPDMVKALGDPEFINLEIIGELYLFRAFEQIDALIKSQVKTDLENYKSEIGLAVAIFIIAYILSGLLLWWKVENRFRVERSGWRKMMRLIPNQMVMTDKLLKDYLINNSEGILDSVKRSFHMM